MSIDVKHLVKRFGSVTVCDGLNLHVPSGELVALLGPSGSGKTSLLRVMAGLEQSDAGSVFLHGEDATHVPVRDRRVGFVFQHYALFGHMSVFDNVAFGLRMRPKAARPDEGLIRERVHQLLQLVQLDGTQNRYPHQLSGGQRQRIALARALAIEPRVLLLDEPFGALDAKVRKELRRWLRQLHDEMRLTTVFVTHDQDEAMEVADRIIVMNRGRIEQEGLPEDVYDQPASAFVVEFLGDVNRLDGSPVRYVRPHDIDVHAQPVPGALPAVLQHVMSTGGTSRLTFRCIDGDEPVDVDLPRAAYRAWRDQGWLTVGHTVYLQPRQVRQFEPAATS